MKKLLAVMLALTMVAMLAVGASAGIFTYDESDGDYWDLSLNVLDQESDEYILVTEIEQAINTYVQLLSDDSDEA